MRVFKQTRRTDGDGRLHYIEEGEEVFYQAVGQLGTQEVTEYLIVAGIAQSQLIQIISIHELIEYIGTQHHRLRYNHLSVLEFIELGMTFHHIIDESQATTLTSQRAVAYASKVRIAVETVALEHCHHSLVLHLTILHDGLEYNLTVSIDIFQRLPSNLLQELSYRKYGTRVKPTRNMVAADMIKERFGWNGEHHVLQFFQVMHPSHLFFSMRITENEIAETEVLCHRLAQVDVHLLRILVDKHGVYVLSKLAVRLFRRLKDKRYERITATHLGKESQSGFRVYLSPMRKTSVGNYT